VQADGQALRSTDPLTFASEVNEGATYTLKWRARTDAVIREHTGLRNREVVRVLVRALEENGPVIMESLEVALLLTQPSHTR
jgi:hypothetical protein